MMIGEGHGPVAHPLDPPLILKRVIVRPAVYPRFLEIAELARSLCHS